MEETFFPPSPGWFLPNIISTRKDGSLAYGSKNNIIILKSQQKQKPEVLIIRNAHSLRITGVAFSPSNCSDSMLDSVVSCSDDGFVKLWKIDTLTATIGHKQHWVNLQEQRGEVERIISLDWSTANPQYVVSAAENNSLVLWDILSNSTVKYSFQTLGATVVSCCPYNEKIVAVGGKTGQIYIISLTGNGHILYKLRGHDNKINSLSWCPVPYNVFKVNDILEEFLLASACQNKEVFIWRVGSDGKCEGKFQIPTSALYKRDGSQHGKMGNSFSYVALCWLEPYKIYTSSNFGELIYFDIKYYLSKKMSNGESAGQKSNKHSVNFVRLGHYFHTKGLFAIAGSPTTGEVEIYKSSNIRSELKVSLQSNTCKVNRKIENECSNDLTWDVTVPEMRSLLWTAGQDRKLVACESQSSKIEAVFNYNTINGTVYCIVACPHDPNKLAIGAGDGMIRLWNLTEPCGEIQVHWQKIKDRVLSLDWHPTKDGLLAYGTSEGRVGLIDTKSNKLPNVFKPSHPQPVYNLSWGPQFSSEGTKDLTSNSEFDLYSVGDNTLYLYSPKKLNSDPLNLSKLISFPCKKQTDVCWKPDYSLLAVGNEDGSIYLVEPSRFKIAYTILAYKKLIQSIAWHPSSTSSDSGLSHYHGYLTSGSPDNNYEIKVFNCQKEEDEVKVEQVATLKGHHGQIQAVAWCPHISCRLVSSSTDSSVQIWDVISQTPLVNFYHSGMPIFSIWSPVDPDFIITGCRSDFLCVWKISTQTKVSPSSSAKTKKTKSGKSNMQLSISKELVLEKVDTEAKNQKENVVVSVAEMKSIAKNSSEGKMFSIAWKGTGDDEMRSCYSLLKNDENGSEERNYSLSFFCSEYDFQEAIITEEESCRNANKWTELCEIALWNGNIKNVLQEKIASGKLNDFIVSLAPVISPKVWLDACLSYSRTLAEKKMYRKAASYLIVCHRIYDAIQLLVDANLYLEAIFIARTRLPKSDPTLEKIVRRYAESLTKNGALLKACQCYVYLDDYLEVAKICGKSKRPEYINLAALAAKKCNSLDLQTSEATNALLKSFETDNFELAQQICDDHSNLRHLDLLYFVYQTIHQLEWGELQLKTDILSHIRDSSKTENVVFPDFLPKLFHRYNSYKNKQQMYTIVAQELSFGALAEDIEEIVTHLIKALSTCYRYEQQHSASKEVHPLYQLCRWLSPNGFLSPGSFFTLEGVRLSSKIKSLRSYLCASIVMNFHANEESGDIVKYMDVLRELKDDLLDADSYKYFKNLTSLRIGEKEFLENHGKLSRRTFERGGKSSGSQQENDATTDGASLLSLDENDGCEMVEECPSESGIECREEVERNPEEMGESEREDSETNSRENENLGRLVENEAENGLEDAIKKNLHLLKSLKKEIENFENERISSPPLFPVCAWLKKLCERFPENEAANLLLQDLEEKWFQMN